MNDIWILAAKDGDGPSGITSEPAGSEPQTSTLAPDTPVDPNGGVVPPPKRGFGNMQFIFLGLMFVMMYFILFRGPRKKQQQHKQMVQTLAKNDKVRTIGGIIGTVVDVKGDEIVLKIDESNNTKIRLSASAIGRNMSKDNS
ncbi:MAG: preprotein translocase subunit YajC [Phycisphaerae bacterium]|nr:preprotein translocase subunit YajC [Phycisphaerae bacterium]